MKKRFKLFTLLMALVLAVAFLPGCGGDDGFPAALQELADEAMGYLELYAPQLDGWWGDLHVALIESEEGEDFEYFEEMQDAVHAFVLQSGYDYIYALYPVNPDVPFVVPYMLTVDGSMDPEEFGIEYEWEEGFTAAWEGDIAAADYLWITEDGGYALSAYAPIHDSEGEVVAILGIDFPVPDDVAEANADWIWIEEDE